MYVCMHVLMCVYVCVRKYIQCVYVSTYSVCVCVCACACVCVHTYIQDVCGYVFLFQVYVIDSADRKRLEETGFVSSTLTYLCKLCIVNTYHLLINTSSFLTITLCVNVCKIIVILHGVGWKCFKCLQSDFMDIPISDYYVFQIASISSTDY